jgi:hypothetical protein
MLYSECLESTACSGQTREASDVLTSSVPTVGKDGLSSDPSTFSAQEANDRSDVLDHSQTTTHAVSFVKFDCFG